MATKELISYVFGEAAKSNIEKRKVGCVIIDADGQIVGKGFNNMQTTQLGYTFEQHAEVAAVISITKSNYPIPCTVYVSHPPCPACAEYLIKHLGSDVVVEVVEEFMKFDGDKLRYDLIPPSALFSLADVLTFGARKYKPHNWLNCKDPERYLAALYRHLEAWRAGEELDSDSGKSHLAHALTNIAFLIELNYNPTDWKK
ncbi:hypothetical protein [Dickeya phage Amaethon]|nr:hypothetical protein [Dickeya phage Amaethon]